MPDPTPSAATLKNAMATQFANRPSLREVLCKQVHKAIVTTFPSTAATPIDTSQADPFTAMRPDEDGTLRPKPLISAMLESFVAGDRMRYDPADELRLAKYADLLLEDTFNQLALGASNDDAEKNRTDEVGQPLSLALLNERLNQVLASLFDDYQQAQIDFWNTTDDLREGITRHAWMRQALRFTLAGNVGSSGLSEQAQACVCEVLLGENQAPSVAALEFSLVNAAKTTQLLHGDLLIEAQTDEQNLLIWCSPAGAIRAFESAQAFGEAVLDELSVRRSFERLSWQRRTLNGDVFLQQSGILLERLLDDIQGLALGAITTSDGLENAVAWLSDPSRWFLEDDFFTDYDLTPEPPDWLTAASSRDRFEYQVATLDQSIAQILAKGKTSLDGIDSLQAYTRRRLREQLLADHPVDANYFSDDLQLHVSVPNPVVDKELPVSLLPAQVITLTQFAISRLDGLENAVVSAITHRENQLIMPWMTPAYTVALIERVDVGGQYPVYVAGLLDDAATREQRIERCGQEWRGALLFDALKAKTEGLVSDSRWQTLAEFCRSRTVDATWVEVAPLAFSADPQQPRRDQATCMFVITLHEPAAVLLYRPLYRSRPLLCFDSEAGLMAAISQPGALQDSIVQWLPRSVVSVYANNGFAQPHLPRQLLDPSSWPDHVAPVSLALQAFVAPIDPHIYTQKRDALLELADRDTVSNSEHRWQVIKQFSWLLFDLFSPTLPGPIGKMVWLVSVLKPLLEADSASQAERTVWSVSLTANLAMLLLHGRLPDAATHTAATLTPLDALAGRFSTAPYLPVKVQARVEQSLASTALAEHKGHILLGHGWGLGPAAQRRALLPFKSHVDLTAATQVDGLDELGGRTYVTLFGGAYEVARDEAGRRVVGPAGELGPALINDGGWRIRTEGFLAGGSPNKKATGGQARYTTLALRITEQVAQQNASVAGTNQLAEQERQHYNALNTMLEARRRVQENSAGFSAEQVDRLIAGYDLRITAKSEEHKAAVRAYLVTLEAEVTASGSIIEHADELLDLQKQRAVVSAYLPGTFESIRAYACEVMVKNSWARINRLSIDIDYMKIRQMADSLNQQLVSHVPDLYVEYKAYLQEIVPIQQRLVDASATLDKFIPQLKADAVVFKGADGVPELPIGELVQRRRITTVNVLLQQALYYSDLSLNYEQPDPGQRAGRFAQELMSESLKAAAIAHGEIQVSTFSTADRAEILQSAWDEYSTAIINAIDIKREGGALVDVPMLEHFIEQMKALKDSAATLLIEPIGEIEGALQPAAKAYVPDQKLRGVAYARNGQIVVGDVVTVDAHSVLEVRNLLDNEVLSRFDRVADAWVERVPTPAVEEARPAVAQPALDTRAAAALAEQSTVLAKAQEYVRQQVNGRVLAGLIDDHVNKLQRLATELQADQGATSTALRAQLAAWPAERRRLLVELYSSTHYPDAQAMRYLHEQNLLKVEYRAPRQVLSDGTALDEYAIRLLAKPGDTSGRIIWAAHFHFANQADVATSFTLGHLKTWTQRKYGWKDALSLAAEGKRIHRGRLTLAQAQGIIPF